MTAYTPSKYETQTQKIAQELIQATRNKGNIFKKLKQQMQLDDKLMDWAMANPGLRVQLFRFIDALPALQSKPEIARHFQHISLPDFAKPLLSLGRILTQKIGQAFVP